MIKKKILIFSIQHSVRQHLQTNYPQRKKKKEKRCNRSIRTNHVHRWRVMTDGEIPRPAGILKKKKTSSLIPLIHVDVRENGTESSVKDARVQLTREN